MMRFLYQERDIYILGNYFDRVNEKLVLYEYLSISRYLKNKTFVFISSDKRVLKEADRVFYFKMKNLV